MRSDNQPYPVVVDTTNSPYARLKPVPINAVTLTDDFWAPRMRVNREVTLAAQYQLLEETGRIDNFRRTDHQTTRQDKNPLRIEADTTTTPTSTSGWKPWHGRWPPSRTPT